MKKTTISARQLFITACFLTIFSCSVSQSATAISAQTSTKSGSIDVRLEGKDIDDQLEGKEIEDGGSATPNPDSINKAINERINKQLSQEQEKKLTTIIESINQLRRAIYGKVERITDDSLTITTVEGITIIPLPESVRVKQGAKVIKTSDIAVDNWVLIIGANSVDRSKETSNSSFTPQQITVFTSNPIAAQPMVELGIIDSITSSSITVISRSSGISNTFSVIKTTKFQNANGSQTTFDKFEKDLTVLVVGYKGEKSNSATVIRSLATLDKREEN